MPALNQPNFSKYALKPSESKYPNLWKGLVGSWQPVLGPQGQRLIDLSGRGNHGTLNGSMTFSDWVVGPKGYALDFDGSNDNVDVDKQIISAYPFTLSAWIITTSSSELTVASLAYNGATDVFWTLGIDVGKARIVCRNTFTQGTNGSITINDGKPHLITCVFVAAADRRLFVDGIADGTNTASVNYASTVNKFAIGRRPSSSPTQYFLGKVNGVFAHSRALQPVEIRALYSGASPHTKKDGHIFAKNPMLYMLNRMTPYLLAKKSDGSGLITARLDYLELKQLFEKKNRF
jgi:hypothetical protein